MTTPRIDIAYRIYDDDNHYRLTVDWGDPSVSGSPASVDLTPGLYLSAEELASHIQTRLSAVWTTPTWSVTTDTDGKFAISVNTGVFSVSWASVSLREWLGWDANISTPTASATADNVCPGVFVGGFPWGQDAAVGQRYSRKVWSGHHQRSGAIKLASVRIWKTNALIDRDSITQWRNVAALLCRGMPATWYRNASDTSAWSYSNFDGKVLVVLDTNSISEVQASRAHDDVLRVPLRFVEWTDPEVDTVGTFDQALTAPELGLRFYVYVQGIGKIFLDGESFINQAGSLWTAPTDKASQSYTLEPYTLDTSGGLKDVGSEISRRSGEVSPGSMTIRLSEDREGTLLDLFAPEKSGGNLANLEDDLDYDTAGTGSVLTVDSTTGWSSTGLAYLGREAIYYPTTASTELGASGNKATRDLFNDVNGTGTTYGDIEYVHNTNRPKDPRVVSDYPRVWVGRWLSVWATVVDPFGRALGTAYKGDWSSEIWRGRISEEPRPVSDDWQRWELQCDEITAILDTEVGREPIQGALLRVPGNVKTNQTASGTVQLGSEEEIGTFFVSSTTNEVSFTVYEYLNANWPDGASAGGTVITASITTGVYVSVESLREAINASVATAIASAITAGDINGPLTLYVVGFSVQLKTESSPSYTYRVVLDYEQSGVLALLGFKKQGSDELVVGGATGGFDAIKYLVKAPFPSIASYVSPTALSIPFFYSENAGLSGDLAPSSGFARIGGEEGETVEYSSITDLTGTLDGLYQMEITTRGAFGTTPKEFVVKINADWTLTIDEVKVEFGVGLDGVHPLDAILQLAVSTGQASHHTSYDTLGRRVSPPLDPNHFDRDQFADEKANMLTPLVRMFFSKSYRLSELVSAWLAPFGRFLHAVRNEDGLYQIQVGRMRPALLSETATTIGSGDIAFYDPARWKGGLNRVVNQIVISPTWDPRTEEFTKDRIVLEDADSVVDYGTKGKLEWKLLGYGSDVMSVVPDFIGQAYHIFLRLARPYLVLEVTTGRAGLALDPGDFVDITLDGMPALDGTRGISSRTAVVLQRSKTWETAIESEGGQGAELLVAVERDIKHSTYSPSAYISAYSAGTPSVTVDPSAGFFGANETAEDHFDAGDKVIIFNGGDVSTRDARTISSISGNVVTLNSALSNASMTAGNTIMIADDYSTATASQKLHAYIADTGTPPDLAGGAASFKYV